MRPFYQLLTILSLLKVIHCQGPTFLGCSLEVVVDPSLRNAISEQLEQDGARSMSENPDGQLQNAVTKMVSDHIFFANEIFAKYDFGNLDTQYKVYLKRLKVLDDEHCEYKGVDYCKDLPEGPLAQTYLEHHSQGNHSDVCLSFLFTNKNFKEGSLGFAYQAHFGGSRGGICDKEADFQEKQEQVSYNTGLVGFTHNYIRVPDLISKFTFAHELGHSFGSQHDYPKDCLFDRDGGAYLMHWQGPKGFHESNYELSSCSVRNISLALKMLARDNRDCLTPVPISTCGNGILEGWEECDCGFDETECHDKCCNPASLGDQGCTLTEGSQCSPSEGPCCSWECQLVPSSNSSISTCHSESECRFPSSCDGLQSFCPSLAPKPDGTLCEDGTKMCQNGQCSASICTKFNMVECHPRDPEHSCEVHCQVKGKPSSCRPSSDLAPFFSEAVMKPPQTICNIAVKSYYDFGYCSSYGLCDQNISPEVTNTAAWVVGLIIFVVIYLLLMVLALWFYCRYCRGKTIKAKANHEPKPKP